MINRNGRNLKHKAHSPQSIIIPQSTFAQATLACGNEDWTETQINIS